MKRTRAARAAESPGPSRTSELLTVENLSVRYANDTLAVNDVSFAVGAGERVALVGESGSGKSTLALAVAGFLMAGGASITTTKLSFQGQALHRGPVSGLPVRTPGISMVLQDAMTSLDPVWTIQSQLLGVIRTNTDLSRKAAIAEAAEWLRRVGLNDTERVLKAHPYELSGGMRQRAMLAIALCGNPKLVIADEPTSALDASLARSTMDLLVDLTAEFGTSLLVVSHDIGLTMQYCDRVLVMYQGVMVEQLAARDLADAASHPYTQGLLRCIPTLDSVELELLPTLDTTSLLDAVSA